MSWPKASSTKTLSAQITVKAGQTYDAYALNGNKWVRFDRGRTNLGDLEVYLVVKMMLFLF